MSTSLAQRSARGYRNRGQGHYAEQYVRALASASGFSVGKSDPEPVGIDLQIKYERRKDVPWPSKTIEVSVKSTSSRTYNDDGLMYEIKSGAHDVLCGSMGVDFDIRRYLVVVVVPERLHGYGAMTDQGLALSHEAYLIDLMSSQPVGQEQSSKSMTLPTAQLLTPNLLSEVLLEDSERACEWLSM
ncbi:DUF4365 domain-containing protein [Arthrobacter rhizosphaerae]|uniref:DUF4365 domain-containing protein n=1 Tax=Arthrobacter rhizosphaerae TaxID=2855490 RepID=UPI0035577716